MADSVDVPSGSLLRSVPGGFASCPNAAAGCFTATEGLLAEVWSRPADRSRTQTLPFVCCSLVCVCVCACEDDEVELQMLNNLGVKSYCFRECTVPRFKSVKRSHVFSHTEAHTAQAGRSCVLRCLSPSTKPQRAHLAPAFIARILRGKTRFVA